MKHDEVIGFAGSGLSTILTITQTNEVFQLIQLICSILSFLVTMAYVIWKWYKKATSKDSPGGEKITAQEVEELFSNLKENIKEEKENEHN